MVILLGCRVIAHCELSVVWVIGGLLIARCGLSRFAALRHCVGLLVAVGSCGWLCGVYAPLCLRSMLVCWRLLSDVLVAFSPALHGISSLCLCPLVSRPACTSAFLAVPARDPVALG